MTIIESLKGIFARSQPAPEISVPLSQATPQLLGWASSQSDYISPEHALTVSAYYAAIRTISEEIGSLPRHVFRKDAVKGRVEDSSSDAARLLRYPNPTLYTGVNFWASLTRNALEHGNGYAQIVRSINGKAQRFILINPRHVEVKVSSDNQISYHILGSNLAFSPYEMLHIVGFSDNGIVGVSPLKYAASTVNTGRFANQFTSKFFENGSNPSFVLTHPGKVSLDAQKTLKSQFASRYSGMDSMHKPLLLEEGMQAESLSIDPEKAQLLELKKYNIEDVARLFRIPLSKLQSREQASYNSLEAENTAFVTETLLPWCRKIEEEFDRKLVPEAEQGSVYSRFSLDGRARGTLAERTAAYEAGIQHGWLNPNEVRASEERDFIPGGDVYLRPLNMTPTDDTGPLQTRSVPGVPQIAEVASGTTPTGSSPTASKTSHLALLSIAAAAATSLATKEAKGLQVALKATTLQQKESNYALFMADHNNLVVERFAPVMESAKELGINLPDCTKLYLTASQETFNKAASSAITVDEYVSSLVEKFTQAFRG